MMGKEEIKELFTFTKKERNGLLVLLFLLFAVIGFRVYVNLQSSHLSTLDTTQFAQRVDSFKALLKAKEDPEYISRLDRFIIERYDSLDLFNFDPNTVSADELSALGFTDKQAQTILNFRAKGGKFYDKNDFRRMYGIRTRQYLILEPYIDLPEKNKPFSGNYSNNNFNRFDKSSETESRKPDSLFSFDPNTADIETLEALGLTYRQAKAVANFRKSGGEFNTKSDLKKIYTIGPKEYAWLKDYIDLPDEKIQKNESKSSELIDINSATAEELSQAENNFWKFNAAGIVKYRDLLGGYIRKEQLLEVYGVEEKYYNYIKDQIAPVNKEPEKIRINFASREELKRHPYISSYDAKTIVSHRNQNGPFAKLSELRKHKLISQTNYDKVKPYLTVD